MQELAAVLDKNALEDRILGCIVGATIGDAIGGAFEMATAEDLQERLGTDWIDDMYDYPAGAIGAYGVWSNNSPAGTGTDDTRMNHIFIEAVIENRGVINSRLLARHL